MEKIDLCSGNFWKEFKAFALRGNVFDLAIGIIIGGAFTKVVESLVNDVLTPPFGFLLGGVDFSNLTLHVNNFYTNSPPVVIRYGRFIQAIIYLVIAAFVLFFVMRLINKLHTLAKAKCERKLEGHPSLEHKVLVEIRDLLAENKENRQLPNIQHPEMRE
ncbi:unnamed protein product [Didymodactylos carnosus]|uniref:Large-conductance mechanosensitive channel n=2 Tax=Didymodactylos carnosus TaxID=1234261 RepID=A0A8S2QT14_9BILA|nr:unnamed protein product [Didymodactylos carnosus]CAF4130418.1 unnamed protein product [Didymodactylos carnosus]